MSAARAYFLMDDPDFAKWEKVAWQMSYRRCLLAFAETGKFPEHTLA